MTNFTQLTSDLSIGRLGKPNGFASLNSAGKLDSSQIPSGIQGGLKFQGLWDASTNTPDLTALTPTNGDLYIVAALGNQDLNGDGLKTFTEGDSVFWSSVEGIWYYQQGTALATEISYTNSSSELNSTDAQAAIDELASEKQNKRFIVNREIITADKVLLNTDRPYQHLITTTASLNVSLPASPINGAHFIIKNSTSSTESFTVNSISIFPSEIYEVIYDGVEWVEI